MSDRTSLIQTIQAFSLVFAMLIEDLEKSGAISRAEFARRVRDRADEAERTAADNSENPERLDIRIARHVAELVFPDKPGAPKGWTPVVIDGGLNEPPLDQS
jgi:hypothetical protein